MVTPQPKASVCTTPWQIIPQKFGGRPLHYGLANLAHTLAVIPNQDLNYFQLWQGRFLTHTPGNENFSWTTWTSDFGRMVSPPPKIEENFSWTNWDLKFGLDNVRDYLESQNCVPRLINKILLKFFAKVSNKFQSILGPCDIIFLICIITCFAEIVSLNFSSIVIDSCMCANILTDFV